MDTALTAFGERGRSDAAKSQLAVSRALDGELIHPVAQGVGMEIQDSRRTLRPINHSACLLKSGPYMASLNLFQGGKPGR